MNIFKSILSRSSLSIVFSSFFSGNKQCLDAFKMLILSTPIGDYMLIDISNLKEDEFENLQKLLLRLETHGLEATVSKLKNRVIIEVTGKTGMTGLRLHDTSNFCNFGYNHALFNKRLARLARLKDQLCDEVEWED